MSRENAAGNFVERRRRMEEQGKTTGMLPPPILINSRWRHKHY